MTPDLPRTPIAEREGTNGLGYSWSDDVYNTLTGGDLGQVLWRRTGGGTDRALHYDHIGNVVAESNTSGAFTATHEQDAYGRAVLASYSGGWGDNSLHQTTKPWDDAIELYQFNARWYDQRVGQFASTAPMPRETEHPKNFCDPNPIGFSDLDGWRPLPSHIAKATPTPAPFPALPTSPGDLQKANEIDYWYSPNILIPLPFPPVPMMFRCRLGSRPLEDPTDTVACPHKPEKIADSITPHVSVPAARGRRRVFLPHRSPGPPTYPGDLLAAKEYDYWYSADVMTPGGAPGTPAGAVSPCIGPSL